MTSETLSHIRQARDQAVTPQSAIPLRPILLRAAVVALVIGSALTLTNQASALFGTARLDVLPLILVYLTSFIVVAISQVFGIRQARRDFADNGPVRDSDEPFRATVVGHGIPFRAVLTGLAAGSANTSITLTAQLLAGDAADALPLAVIAQAYALPTLFGAPSQALSYRRAVAPRTALLGT